MSDIFGFRNYWMLGDPRQITAAEMDALNRWSDLGRANYRPFDMPVVERDDRFGYCYEALK